MLLVDTSLLFTKVIEVLSIIILLIVWVYGMIIGRISLRESGTVQNSTIFQFHFLTQRKLEPKDREMYVILLLLIFYGRDFSLYTSR